MHRLILFSSLLAVALGATAQDARTICGRHVAAEGVKVVSVSPTKFASTRQLPAIAMEQGTLQLAPLVTAFRSYYLLTSTNAEANTTLDAEVAALIRDGGYQLLLMSGEADALTAMYGVVSTDSITSLLLCSQGGGQTVFMALDADLARADLDAATAAVALAADDAKGEAHTIAPTGDVTSTTSHTKMSSLDAANFTDIYAYIRAKVGSSFRGSSSVNSGTEPIYVVDGIQVTNIGSMSPIDVYSVEFIKDASTSIYGFRGVNGVINIVTKAAHQQKESETAARDARRSARRTK